MFEVELYVLALPAKSSKIEVDCQMIRTMEWMSGAIDLQDVQMDCS
jgi:hypothetical protein